MKRKLVFIFFGLFIFSSFLNAQSLDEAIIVAAVKISGDLPANTKAAVLNFRSNSEKLNDYVINELYGAILRNRRIVPVKPDQNQLQNIRGDLGPNMDIVNKESAQRIGRLLGAQYIITGSLQRIGSEYKINFDAIDTNAEIKSLYSASLNPQNDSQFALLLGISVPATASIQSQKEKQQDEIKNFVSIYPAVLGIGAGYEYMMNSKISLGVNINWYFSLFTGSSLNVYFEEYTVGIDAAFRFYPWGKTFFLGTALGFYFLNGIANYHYGSGAYSTFYSFALGITPEIGWKIDVGEKGGLFLQLGFGMLTELGRFNCDDPSWDFCWESWDRSSSTGPVIALFPRIYFGIGNAF